MGKPVSIAYLGKGGTGKSIISALTGKIAISMNKKVLLIDADPAMGLATALGIKSCKTIGQAREEIIRQAKIADSAAEKERLSDIVDYLLLEAVYEGGNFSMIVMGHTNSVGCYCPINSLLRETIKSIADNFDVIIIDAEAGIEQISRQVTESVQYPVILTDNSRRGVTTALLARDAIDNSPGMKPVKRGVIFNRVTSDNAALIGEITGGGLEYYGSIAPDMCITERDAEGLTPFEMPDDSPSLTRLKEILTSNKILTI